MQTGFSPSSILYIGIFEQDPSIEEVENRDPGISTFIVESMVSCVVFS